MSLFSDVFSLPVHLEFFAIFSYCLHFAKFVCLFKKLQRLKQEWQKSTAGTSQTHGKNQVWFGEIEIKLANYQRLLLLTVLPVNYFMLRMLGVERCGPVGSSSIFSDDSELWFSYT
jgi:hypothetical protein